MWDEGIFLLLMVQYDQVENDFMIIIVICFKMKQFHSILHPYKEMPWVVIIRVVANQGAIYRS